MHIRTILAVGLMLIQAWAFAQITDASSQLTLDQARAQRAKAKDLKAQARKTFEAEKKACQDKAIAIGCMSSAKDRRAESFRQADALEREGRMVEREALRQEVDKKAAKREAEAPGRQAREQADIERYRESEAKRVAERERRQAAEVARIESRRSKLAAEQAARQKKTEERRQKDAKLAAEAPEMARKKAERERKHAERVKKIDERKRKNAEQQRRWEAKQAAQQGNPPAPAPVK